MNLKFFTAAFLTGAFTVQTALASNTPLQDEDDLTAKSLPSISQSGFFVRMTGGFMFLYKKPQSITTYQEMYDDIIKTAMTKRPDKFEESEVSALILPGNGTPLKDLIKNDQLNWHCLDHLMLTMKSKT